MKTISDFVDVITSRKCINFMSLKNVRRHTQMKFIIGYNFLLLNKIFIEFILNTKG